MNHNGTPDPETRRLDEDALQALRRAGDPESRRRAAEALDRATRRIRERYAPPPPPQKQ